MVKVIRNEDPDDRIRREWAELLAEHMTTRSMSRKDLQHRLSEIGIEVTHQAISAWLRGTASPRPHTQAAIAYLLEAPPRALWPLHYESAA